MKTKADPCQEKPAYEAPRVLASYEKEELEDAIGLEQEVEGQEQASDDQEVRRDLPLG